MKTNELMPGDLVTFKDCQNDATPTVLRVWQINEDNEAFVRIDDYESLDEIGIDDEVVGIPLTPEILEKNGFEKRYAIGHLEWVLFNDSFSISIEEWLEEPSEHNYVLKYERADILEPFTQLTFSYVHEFQHALRLCGIELNIVV